MENIVLEAYEFAKERHKGQIKPGNRPMIQHLDSTCNILKTCSADKVCLCAALLHDVLEDTETKLGEIKEKFGDEVAFLVNGLTKQESTEETLNKIRDFSKKDRRIILIKIAGLKDNLQNVLYFNNEKQKKVRLWFLMYIGFLFTLVKTKQEKEALHSLKSDYAKIYR